MNSSPSPAANAITLDQLIALNDEIAALARMGVPMERGLVQLGDEMPGRLGRVATEIGRRLEQGESLTQVVSDTDHAFPPIYRTVVEAGVRSGRLAAALESLTRTMRRIAELRRMVNVATIYPIFLLWVAYATFAVVTTNWSPLMVSTYHDFELNPGLWQRTLAAIGTIDWRWWLVPPIVYVCVTILLRARRVWRWMTKDPSLGWLDRLPPFGRLIRTGRLAAFSEVLTLLVESNVPLDEAVTLAADACGDQPLQGACETVATRLQRGEPIGGGSLRVAGFPPLLGWLLAGGNQHGELVRALRHSADVYHQRAQQRSNWLYMYFPIFLAAGIGGTAALVLTLSTLGPWYYFLNQISG